MAQAASKPFADSLLQLPTSQMARAGGCGGGSRVLEAFLNRPDSRKKEVKKLLRKLQGSFGRLALSPSGCFLVEKCFSAAVSDIMAQLRIACAAC